MMAALTLDSAKNFATFIAVLIGISSGIYALYQSFRKSKTMKEAELATAASKAEAQRLADRSAAITALEAAVKAQELVIAGLTTGLQECIERDNTKQGEINKLREQIDALGKQVSALITQVAKQ